MKSTVLSYVLIHVAYIECACSCIYLSSMYFHVSGCSWIDVSMYSIHFSMRLSPQILIYFISLLVHDLFSVYDLQQELISFGYAHIYISIYYMNLSLVHSPSCHFFILLFIYLSVHPSSIHGRDSGTASSTKRISCVPSVTQLLGWPRLDAATKVEIVNIYDTVNGKIKNFETSGKDPK